MATAKNLIATAKNLMATAKNPMATAKTSIGGALGFVFSKSKTTPLNIPINREPGPQLVSAARPGKISYPPARDPRRHW